jgi:uncharacterized membrane protein
MRREAAQSSLPSGQTTLVPIVASFGLLSLLVVTMVCFRIVYTHTFAHIAILWNLVLAWTPFCMALLISRRAAADMSSRVLVLPAALWLIVLPNAPYTLTDLKYVGAGSGIPVMYDVLLLSAAAWTGLLLGFTSLFLMQALARRVFGAAAAWALVGCALALSSFGIYLGRAHRWNSWDLLVRPAPLGADVAHSLSDPRALLLTVLLTAFLLAVYLAVYSLRTGASAFSTPVVARRRNLEPPAS